MGDVDRSERGRSQDAGDTTRDERGPPGKRPRAAVVQRQAAALTVRPWEVQSASVELAAALVALDPTLAAGWCARAWLIGGAVAIASNVVCSPTNRPEISGSPWR